MEITYLKILDTEKLCKDFEIQTGVKVDTISIGKFPDAKGILVEGIKIKTVPVIDSKTSKEIILTSEQLTKVDTLIPDLKRQEVIK